MRVKRGPQGRRRHKKILRMARGYWGRRSKTFRAANQQVMRALWNSYRDRRRRKRDFRRLWITRINAGARQQGVSYSVFMSGLRKAGIAIDRKILADLAMNDSEAFAALVEKSRAALAAS